MAKVYGCWDTVDKVWMGNSEGPLKYKQETMARMAATIINERCDYNRLYSARIVPKVMPKEKLRYRDSIKPKISTEAAIDQLEKRT
jgi:hypothetical protein